MDMHMSTSDHDANCPEKKGPWSPEEDERLRDAVGTNSPRPKWAEIANQVEGRSAKQCRERWEQNLSPRLNKNPISRSEGQYIIDFVDTHGKKWAEIARQLTNRSDNNIKNWYNGMVQKGKTGRGAQDDNLRLHFLPDHQHWLSTRGRKTAPSPQMDPRHHHGFHPYGQRATSYPMQAGAPYGAPYAAPHYGPPPPQMYAPHHPAQHMVDHRHSAPILPPPTTLAPVQQPTQSLRLPPLQSPALQQPQEHRGSDYFGQPEWHSRSLTVQTSLHPDYSRHSQVSAVSPMTRNSAESQELPPLSGSAASTPLGGSPLTPALSQSEVYRHRHGSHETTSTDYEHSIKEEPKSSAGQSKMDIMNLCN